MFCTCKRDIKLRDEEKLVHRTTTRKAVWKGYIALCSRMSTAKPEEHPEHSSHSRLYLAELMSLKGGHIQSLISREKVKMDVSESGITSAKNVIDCYI